MSEAPERIWASLSDERFDNVAFHGGWASVPSENRIYEYIRADLFDELEAQIEELHHGVTAAHFQGYIEGGQAAEDKLAKAMKTLECYAGYWADDKTFIRTDDGGELASETIEELIGGKDD